MKKNILLLHFLNEFIYYECTVMLIFASGKTFDILFFLFVFFCCFSAFEGSKGSMHVYIYRSISIPVSVFHEYNSLYFSQQDSLAKHFYLLSWVGPFEFHACVVLYQRCAVEDEDIASH